MKIFILSGFLRQVPGSRLPVVVCESKKNDRLPLVDRLG